MTLPTNSTSTVAEDDSDMFGPPHSSPPIRRNRPKVPMISPQLKQREVRKRILQLCVHKLERIKDSERNLRRSVCINNTYSRLTDDIRREKQHKLLMLSNLAKSTDSSRKESEEDDPSADDCINNNITNANNNNNNTNGSSNNHHHHLHPHHHHHGEHGEFVHNNENMNNNCQLQHNHNLASHQHHHHHLHHHLLHQRLPHAHSAAHTDCNGTSSSSDSSSTSSSSCSELLTSTTMTTEASDCSKPSGATVPSSRKSSSEVETDLETLDRELCALDAAMPLVDPEITQGAEQLEQAMVSRKRKFASIDDDDSDRLVREALSQIYFPSAGRLLTGIDDCPPATTTDGGAEGGAVEDQQSKGTSVSETIGDLSPKRPKIGDLLEHHHHHHHHYQLHPFSHPFLHPFHPLPDLSGFDYQVAHHHQKEFEVIMDALRLGVSNGGAMAAVVAAKSAGAVAAAAAAAAAATGNATGTAMGCGVGGAAAGNGHGQPVASCNGAGGASPINPTPATTIDSCGQAAMLMGSDGGASVFHNLVVTSLET
ncbi:AGAP001828-PA-like protein [Anopheles sinensis]|uniref:AGAP001828-PA-like protein n=1 Tax=Anopheles sinensis TaxID=74873 RepID=A0A084VRR0_ANOSI|nr:AGAP001828-PA-like protein [Anopheles sinensis]